MPKGIPNAKPDTASMAKPAEKIVQAMAPIVHEKSIEVAEGPLLGDYAEQLAFMEQTMEIVIQESNNPNDENPVYAGCNGEIVAIWRGRPAKVKRKFVESLLGKTTIVDTPEFTNSRGERDYNIRQRSGQRYNLQVIHDPDRRGIDWLRGRVSSAH